VLLPGRGLPRRRVASHLYHRSCLDVAVVCFLWQRETPVDGAADPMLLEQEVCFSVPPPRASGRRWTLPHHRQRLWFRREYRRPQMSQPTVTAPCPPRLLPPKGASTALWMRFRRDQTLLFSRPQPVRRCSRYLPWPPSAAAQDSTTNSPGFRSLVVAKFRSCAASTWRLMSSTESSRPVAQVVTLTRC
jgi:hypothetical protein